MRSSSPSLAKRRESAWHSWNSLAAGKVYADGPATTNPGQGDRPRAVRCLGSGEARPRSSGGDSDRRGPPRINTWHQKKVLSSSSSEKNDDLDD